MRKSRFSEAQIVGGIRAEPIDKKRTAQEFWELDLPMVARISEGIERGQRCFVCG
jgi:hypothetical protein